MANIATFNSLAGFGINNQRLVIDANANVTANTVVATGFASVTGNITGGNIITTGSISSTGNVTVGNIRTAGIISATGNVTGDVFSGNGINLTNTGPASRAIWAAAINGSNLTPAFGAASGGLGGWASYVDSFYGVRLTNGLSQTGYATWNLSSVQWSAPVVTFRASVASYAGSGADGIWMCFGGSSASIGSGSTYGGILVYFWYYANKLVYQIANGSWTQIAMAAGPNGSTWNSQTIYNASYTSWYDLSMVLHNYGTKRYVEFQVNGSSVYMIDATGWTPAGNYLTVGGATGGADAIQYVRNIVASW